MHSTARGGGRGGVGFSHGAFNVSSSGRPGGALRVPRCTSLVTMSHPACVFAASGSDAERTRGCDRETGTANVPGVVVGSSSRNGADRDTERATGTGIGSDGDCQRGPAWSPCPAIANYMGIDLFKLTNVPPCISGIEIAEEIWTTAVVCMVLRKNYSEELFVWQAVVVAAIKLLRFATKGSEIAIRSSIGFDCTRITCNQGHTLEMHTKEELIAEDSSYSEGFSCDLCCSQQPQFTTVMHCPQCGFDVCQDCVTGSTPSILFLAKRLFEE
ncbi:hypothetical protein Pelo_12138 [Pelomyxa schiedti]|nr:hypothetical protein Pelo_12138 [Pelomyxa schiedti]